MSPAKRLLFLTALLAGWTCFACTRETKEEYFGTRIDRTSIALHYDESHQFKLTKNKEPVNPLTYRWITDNEVAGRIDSTGKYTGNRIGETTVTATHRIDHSSIITKVYVVPYSTICREPILSFGIDRLTLAKMEHRKLSSIHGDTTMSYAGENSKINYVVYQFKEEKLVSSSLIFETSEPVLYELFLFMDERYPYLGQRSGVYYFEPTPTIQIAVGVDEAFGLYARYEPKPPGIQKPLSDHRKLLR